MAENNPFERSNQRAFATPWFFSFFSFIAKKRTQIVKSPSRFLASSICHAILHEADPRDVRIPHFNRS
jgi:hypothetical protein